MPYTDIQELPTQVKGAFDETDAGLWMDAYNKYYNELDGDVETARILAWKECMELPSSFAVEEWATVEDVDVDGEVVALDSVIKNLDKYYEIYGGAMQDTHTNSEIGTVWGAEERIHEKTGLPGLVVYYNLYGGTETTNQARKDWMEGKNHLSVGGNAGFKGYQCDAKGCYINREVTDLYEISICEYPANPHANVISYNAGRLEKAKDTADEYQNYDGHKVVVTIEHGGALTEKDIASIKEQARSNPGYRTYMRAPGTNYIYGYATDDGQWHGDEIGKSRPKGTTTIKPFARKIHSDSTYCAMQRVHKAMRDVGVPCDVRMEDYNVRITTEDEHVLPLMRSLDNMGMLYCYDVKDASFIVKGAKDTYEKYKGRLTEGGHIEADGMLKSSINEETFCKLYNYDMLEKKGDAWFFKEPGAMTAGVAGASHARYGGGSENQQQMIQYSELQRFKDKVEGKGNERKD